MSHALVGIEYLDHYPREFGDVDYANEGDAGFDLRAAIDAPIKIYPGNRVFVPCGIRLAIPAHHEVQIRSRSGLAKNHGIVVLNAPGTVDSGYVGEIGVILHNTDPHTTYTVARGERIAQAVLAQVVQAQFIKGPVSLNTARGGAGFGSTGIM